MNPPRFVDLIATRHPNNLMLPGQRRDDSDTPARGECGAHGSEKGENPLLDTGALSEMVPGIRSKATANA